jgi:hypothetical protein
MIGGVNGNLTLHLQRHIREVYLNDELEQTKPHPVGFPGTTTAMFEPYISGLTAVSSFRALDDSAEVAENQLRAKRSWDLVFDRILLFGKRDERLASPTTDFIPSLDFPNIASMALVASAHFVPVCLLNADIVVAPDLKVMVNKAWAKGAVAMTSQRLEFDPKTEDYFRARVVDYGCDFFCAKPDVWKQVYKAIPQQFRIGHQRWDQWMLNFLWHTYRRRFVDITTLGPIFHPKHEGRKMPHHIDVTGVNFYQQIGFPPAL